jgi:hypothetical protein
MEEDDLQPQRREWELPGTPRGEEIQRQEDQQGFIPNVQDAFVSGTAAGAAGQILEDEAQPLRDELFPETEVDPETQDALTTSINAVAEASYQFMAGAASLVGIRAGDADYDQTEMYDELTQGIPYAFHDEIVGNVSLAAARRARARVQADLDRGRRISNQLGTTSTMAILAGSVVDVDLPLTFMSGGGYGAARVARAGVKFGQITRMSAGAAQRTTSGLVGASAGLQAGLASGAGQMVWRETEDWTVLAEAAMAGMVLGGGLNAAVKGDIGLQIKAAQDEFYENVAADTATVNGKGLDLEGMRVDPLVIYDDVDSTMGAAQVGGAAGASGPATTPRVNRNNLNSTPSSEQITTMTENWRHNTGWLDRKRDGEQEWLHDFITKGTGQTVARDYAKLYGSESPTLNFLAGAVFESPHGYGRGRATAATLKDHYNMRIVAPIFKAQDAMNRWANRNNVTLANSGVGTSAVGMRQFNRQVMLEVNARRQGRQYSTDPDVLAATDAYQRAAEEALAVAKGRQGQVGLDGFDQIQSGPYLPYRWNGRKLRDMIRNGVVKEQSVIDGLANSYRAAGMVGKDAESVAKAVVLRMRSQAEGVPGTLQDLMSRDGRD